jgi:hypothetical protein
MKKYFVVYVLLLVTSLYGINSILVIDWVGNMFPSSGSSNTISEGDDITIYVQVYKAGVTEPAGEGSGIICEIYYGKVPAFGQPWDIIYTQAMTYNVDIGNNDEYQGTISPSTGLYEFTCRCSDDGGASWTFADLPSGNGMLTVDAILPVEMSFFQAEVFSNSVKLAWETSIEVNNHHFEIERSVDLKNWEIIGFIDGKGNSSEENNYQHIDKSPVQGLNYYRLKQVDFNNKFSYSSVVNINFRTLNKSSVFPNPTKDVLVILHANDKSYLLQLVSINGQVIKTYFPDESTTEIDLSNIPRGIYVLKIKNQSGHIIERHKIIKI